MRFEDTDRITVMNTYHKECIACHGDMKVAGEKSGPVECNECHAEKSRFVSSRQPMGMDKSLHYRHVAAQEQKSLSVLIREAVEELYFVEQDRERRRQALADLIGLGAPTGAWEQMEAQITRGALDE